MFSPKYTQTTSVAEGNALNRFQIEQNDKKYSERYSDIYSRHSSRTLKPVSGFNYSDIAYKQIKAIQISQNENAADVIRKQLIRTFSAMWTMKLKFYLFVRFDGLFINFYIGTDSTKIKQLCHVFEGSVSGIEFNEDRILSFNDIIDNESKYIGMFNGNPVVREYIPNQTEYSVIDEVLTGTYGTEWSFSVCAVPVSSEQIMERYNKWLKECTESSENVSVGYSNKSGGNISESMNTNKIYAGSEMYNKYAAARCSVLQEALQCGQWTVTAVCFARTPENLDLFGGLLSSQLKSGTDTIERPLPFQFYNCGRLSKHPGLYLMCGEESCFGLSSREMSMLCSMPVNDKFGFRVSERADFDVSSDRKGNFNIGSIIDGVKITKCAYNIDRNTLNRHGLVIGLTGGGKTNTVKSLVHSIHQENLPFMIIEPAKKEYYELYRMGFKNLQVYSVGSNTENSLKINPFEFMEGISLQAHIDAVFSAFKASFIMYTPMPYVLEIAIYEIYKDYGWDVETGTNKYNKRIFPTIEDLYYKIRSVIVSMGYDDKMKNDLIGSMQARINSLRVGSKGAALNVARSMPIPELLKGEVIIELDDVGDEEAKAFLISLILMQLNECRKSDIISRQLNDKNANLQLAVQHIVIIEEAHRLLKNIPSGSGENADPRGAAVEYFCNMLAEIRSKGQGFIVVDQIPSKLAPDLIKNTNLKIIHRTVDSEDRQLVGGAMHMTENQTEYLSCLGQGEAAVYSEGDNRPKLVKLPYAKLFEKETGLENMERDEILRHTLRNCLTNNGGYQFANQAKINRICASCPFAADCIRSGSYINARLLKHFSEQEINNLISQAAGCRMEKDIHTWITTKYRKIIEGKGIDYTMRCMFAVWFEKCENLMDYADKSNVIINYMKLLNN